MYHTDKTERKQFHKTHHRQTSEGIQPAFEVDRSIDIVQATYIVAHPVTAVADATTTIYTTQACHATATAARSVGEAPFSLSYTLKNVCRGR